MKKISFRRMLPLILVVIFSCFALTSCANSGVAAKAESNDLVQQDTKYILDNCNVVEMDAAGFLNADTSYIELKTDGTFILQLSMNRVIYSLVPGLLKSLDNTESADVGDAQINAVIKDIEKYITGYFPGQSVSHVGHTLEKVNGSLGLHFVGIGDYYEAKTFGELATLIKNGKYEDFALRVEAPYHLTKIESLTQDKPFDAVVLGKSEDPYIILTRYEKNGKDTLLLWNEVVSLSAEFVIAD